MKRPGVAFCSIRESGRLCQQPMTMHALMKPLILLERHSPRWLTSDPIPPARTGGVIPPLDYNYITSGYSGKNSAALNPRDQFTKGNTIAPQLIHHDLPGFATVTPQQPFEEALSSHAIPAGFGYSGDQFTVPTIIL